MFRTVSTRQAQAMAPDRWMTIAAVLLVAIVVLGGGASRNDVPSQMLVQASAAITGALLLAIAPPHRLRRAAPALWFMAACVLLCIVQLAPLPASLWGGLPGHERYAAAAALAKVDGVWRPLSLTPDLTLDSLFGLLPAAAGVIVAAAIPRDRIRWILLAIVIGAAASALLGLAQLSSASPTGLRFYSITSRGNAVGFFANRNHQAMFLVLAIVLSASWLRLEALRGSRMAARVGLVTALVLFLAAMTIATQSRAGLVLLAVGSIAATAIAWPALKAIRLPSRRLRMPLIVGSGLAALGLVGGVLWTRGSVIERLIATDPLEEERVQWLSTLSQMFVDFWPLGSGLGSFPSVYRSYEPFEQLRTTYLNHAHNDFFELLIETGVLCLPLLGLLAAWMVREAVALVRARRRSDPAIVAAIAGLTVMLLLLVASIPDYPLRTPLLSFLFALSGGWLVSWRAIATEPAASDFTAR